jgi:hypothetical protein
MMELPSVISSQLDQLEMETSKTQSDADVVNFYIEDDSEWLGLDAATKSSLDELEKSGAAKRH